ncbi:MAG: hypothetical protein KBH25_08305 [Aeromonadaceae bacterium]|nr:hypothetical protein [Aeromonadaceae bacterium]
MREKNIRLILADYEGVVARSSSQILLQISYQEICKHRDVPFDDFRKLYQCLLPTPSAMMLDFLLHAFGQSQLKPRILELVSAVQPCLSEWNRFLAQCHRRHINVKVLTGLPLGDPDLRPLRALMAQSQIIHDNRFSKLNLQHYRKLVVAQRMAPERILYVAGNPLGLMTAKQTGIHAVMMDNPVYTAIESGCCHQQLDGVVQNFSALADLLWPDEEMDLAL